MIHCKIITPVGYFKEFDTTILNVDTIDGTRGILKNHTPLVTILNVGKISTIENGQRNEYAISGGLLYFSDNNASILTDSFENKDDIDLQRATFSRDRALKRLDSNDESIDYERAKKSLAKAVNRMKVKNGI